PAGGMGAPEPEGEARTLAAVVPSTSARAEWPRLLALAGACLAIFSYRAVGEAFYGGLAPPPGRRAGFLLPAEVSAFAVFVAFGGVAWALLALALVGLAPVRGAACAVRGLARRPVVSAVAVGILLTAACASIARVGLGHAVTSDDEHVY